MHLFRRTATTALVLTLAGGLAACGSSDTAATSNGKTTTTGAAGEGAAFCDATVAFNTALFSNDLNAQTPKADIISAGGKLITLFKAVADSAPASLTDQANELQATLAPLAQGDATTFSDPATQATYGKFLSTASTDCPWAKTDVTATDYAFAAPDTIQSGAVVFSFTNAAKDENHEMVLLRKGPGVNLTWKEILALPQDQGQSKTEFITAAQAGPGEHTTALTTLEPGNYAMVCFLPMGGKEGAPPHFTQGMFHEFTVS